MRKFQNVTKREVKALKVDKITVEKLTKVIQQACSVNINHGFCPFIDRKDHQLVDNPYIPFMAMTGRKKSKHVQA